MKIRRQLVTLSHGEQILRALLSPGQVVTPCKSEQKFESLAKPEAACCAELKRARFDVRALPSPWQDLLEINMK